MAASIPRDFPVTAPNLALAWGIPAASLLFAAGSVWWGWSRDPAAIWTTAWPRSGPLVVTLVLIASAVIVFACIHRRRVTLDDRTLRVSAGIASTKVDLAQLDLANAKIVDLDTSQDVHIGIKQFGTAMPGLKAGRFRLKDGRNAFVLITDRHRVLALPELDGRMLLLSLERPQQLLDALGQLAASARRR